MAGLTARILSRNLLRNNKAIRSVCAYSTQSSPRSPIVTNDTHEIFQETGALIHEHPDYFQVRELFSMKELFDAKVHYGHMEGSLHDTMKPFIFGSRLGHLIINLEETVELLYQALNFISYIAYNGGIILFIGRNPQFTHLIETTAIDCGEYSHTKEWRQGTFTSPAINADFRLPDLCIFLSTLNGTLLEHSAIIEAAKMCIPTVAICDTNSDRKLITYPIPGNDDSAESVSLYCKLFQTVILAAKESRLKYEAALAQTQQRRK